MVLYFSKYTYIRFFLVVLVLGIIAGSFFFLRITRSSVTTFDECGRAGYAILESFPRRCIDADGAIFVEDIGTAIPMQDRIRLTSPVPNTIIGSPLIVSGEARENWFADGPLLVELIDTRGNVLGTARAEAQSSVHLGDFVPLSAKLEWFPDRVSSLRGTVRITKYQMPNTATAPETLLVPVFLHLQE